MLGVSGSAPRDIIDDPVPALYRLYRDVPGLTKKVQCPLCGKKARLDTIAELHLNDGVCFGPGQQPWRVKRIAQWALVAEKDGGADNGNGSCNGKEKAA